MVPGPPGHGAGCTLWGMLLVGGIDGARSPGREPWGRREEEVSWGAETGSQGARVVDAGYEGRCALFMASCPMLASTPVTK